MHCAIVTMSEESFQPGMLRRRSTGSQQQAEKGLEECP